jgi:hypothetical protein
MSVTLGNPARSASCDATVDLVDGGAGAGKLKLKSAADAVLCIITLADPAFGAAANGVATAAGLPKSGTGLAAAGAGTAATKYDVTDSADTVIWSGTIPADLTLDNASIAENQTVTITSWTHTQPA